MGIKDEDLAGLSDEERAALEDEDDEGSEDTEADGAEDDEGDAGDEPAAAAADDADGDDDAGDDAGKEPPVAEEFQPEFKASAPENLADRLAELDQKESDIEKKFDDGEIDRDELRRHLKVISEERQDLKIADALAKQAEKQNTDSREQRWKWEQERFFGKKENADTYKDGVLVAALDAQVKQLAGDPANAKRPAGWFLEEADRLVRERFGGPQKAPAAKSRQPDLSAVPKTLAQMPAADIAETGDGEFAYLDKLDGLALEKALSKMTPEQEARYLGMAA
jgi:hypothetical protein